MTSAERFMRERIGHQAGHGRMATPPETVKHLKGMVHKFGSGVLTPVERRCLDRLEKRE